MTILARQAIVHVRAQHAEVNRGTGKIRMLCQSFCGLSESCIHFAGVSAAANKRKVHRLKTAAVVHLENWRLHPSVVHRPSHAKDRTASIYLELQQIRAVLFPALLSTVLHPHDSSRQPGPILQDLQRQGL